MNNNVTDRDCINLSELAYQNIGKVSKETSLFNVFYSDNQGHLRNDIQSEIKEDYKKELATFPDYYIPTFEKYKLIDANEKYTDAGYYGTAFLNIHTNDIIISNRGTEKLLDLYADTGFVTGNIMQLFTDGFKYYEKVIKLIQNPQTRIDYNNIYLTGHSLGGGIAALQFIKYHGGDSRLKETRTFEAPGVGIILNNINSPGNTTLSMKPELYLNSNKAREFSNEVNSTDEEYQQRMDIQRKYSKMSSFYKEQMIQYGTTLDWIYNGLPHIGNCRNPLSQDGKYIPVGNLSYLAERGPVPPVDVYHSMSTYKIYALKSDDNINCGHINLHNFFKFVTPFLVTLNLNSEQIVDFYSDMYDGNLNSDVAVTNALLRSFKGLQANTENRVNHSKFVQAMDDNRGIRTGLYKYAVLLGFLKNGGPDKASFLNVAEKMIRVNPNGSIAVVDSRRSTFDDIIKMTAWNARKDADLKLLTMRLSQMYSPDRFDITAIHPYEMRIRNNGDLRGYLILLKLQSENSFLKLIERSMYRNYIRRFIRYSNLHSDFFQRKYEMLSIVREIRKRTLSRDINYI